MGKPILVVGDIMLDLYTQAQASSLSSEMPVPICKVISQKAFLGGAGNVAANINSLGSKPFLIGVTGTDQAYEEIKHCLCHQDLYNTSNLITSYSCTTTIKNRVITNGHQTLRLDTEKTHLDFSEAIYHRAQSFFESHKGIPSLLVLSDYHKGTLTSSLIRELLVLAEKEQALCLVDTKNKDLSDYHGSYLLKFNHREAIRAATHLSQVVKYHRPVSFVDLRDFYQIQNLIITMGPDGLLLFQENQTPKHISASRVSEVYDVTGAGDTVLAALAVALAEEKPMEEAMLFASGAAGIAVGKPGTALVQRKDVDRLSNGYQSKIMDVRTLSLLVQEWQSKGEKVVWTNGCFDVLHPGHLDFLQRAKHLGNRLVVGLNTDEGVRSLKGKGRPIFSEKERATSLAMLSLVDAVVLFFDNPVLLLEALHPDYLVKGAEYCKENVLGASLVESYGGKVVLLPRTVTYSTTSLLSRLSSLSGGYTTPSHSEK